MYGRAGGYMCAYWGLCGFMGVHGCMVPSPGVLFPGEGFVLFRFRLWMRIQNLMNMVHGVNERVHSQLPLEHTIRKTCIISPYKVLLKGSRLRSLHGSFQGDFPETNCISRLTAEGQHTYLRS